MRLTTDFFVSALVRRAFGQGGFAAVVRRGATEAGSVFLITRGRMGEMTLYGPAAQTAYGEGEDERRFQKLIDTLEPGEVDARLEREARFDPDLWVVEIELDQPAFEEMVALTPP